MARKNYSDAFRRQAVDLYESTPGATVRGIADDLGVERGTLRHRLDQFGTGKKTAADGTITRSPPSPSSRRSRRPGSRRPRNSGSRGLRPGSRSWRLRLPSSPPSGRSSDRRPSISLGRRAGDPLPVRRRPPGRLRGEADVWARRGRAFVDTRGGSCCGARGSGSCRRRTRREAAGHPCRGQHDRGAAGDRGATNGVPPRERGDQSGSRG